MKDKEIVGLYEAYQSIYSNVNEEVEQLDELSDRTVSNALNARIAATGAAADRAYKHRNPEAMRAAEKAADEEARMRFAVARRRKRKGLKEEVETWVNALVEEGYDLSDYTWDDMYEMYMSETRRDPRGRPASGPMSVYGGRGEPSPDPEGDDNISKMDAAQRRVKRTKPRAQGMAADALFTKYSARQSGMEHGGEEGPGPKAPRRGGRSGRGANTDRGGGHAAERRKRRMSEDFDLFDTIIEHLVAEGYAETNEAALAIMANMSEEWRESIVEEAPERIKRNTRNPKLMKNAGPARVYNPNRNESEEEPQKRFTGEGPKKPKGWKPTGPKRRYGERPGYAR